MNDKKDTKALALTKKVKPVGGTLEEWSLWYEQSTGEKLNPDSREEQVLFNPDRGFMSYLIYWEEREFYGHYVAGDGRFWLEVAKQICKQLGLEKIRFFTRHDPRLAARLTGAHVHGYLMELEVGDSGREQTQTIQQL